jgi:hypothetical protein
MVIFDDLNERRPRRRHPPMEQHQIVHCLLCFPRDGAIQLGEGSVPIGPPPHRVGEARLLDIDEQVVDTGGHRLIVVVDIVQAIKAGSMRQRREELERGQDAGPWRNPFDQRGAPRI